MDRSESYERYMFHVDVLENVPRRSRPDENISVLQKLAENDTVKPKQQPCSGGQTMAEDRPLPFRNQFRFRFLHSILSRVTPKRASQTGWDFLL